MTRIAVLDDWQDVARASADWSALAQRAELVFFTEPFLDSTATVRALEDFDAVVIMRERSAMPAAMIEQLPRLRMVAMTGARTWTLDIAACTARGILVCNTGVRQSGTATAELALGLLLSAARSIPAADAAIRRGGFQGGVAAGRVVAGLTLGIIGLGKIGSQMARYGQALGMQVLAWSQNLTAEVAQAAGAQLVDKDELLERSDAVSLHMVLSERSRGIIGAAELARMKPGAILVNTSRGPLIDEAALVARLRSGSLVAALDVYDREPIAADHPLRSLPNTVLTPHLGYCTADVYAQFYGESVENVMAWLDGKPVRMVNPEVLA